MKFRLIIIVFCLVFVSCNETTSSELNTGNQDTVSDIHNSLTSFQPPEEFKSIVSELNKIFEDDQSGRNILDTVEKAYGIESKEVKDLWKIIAEKDSINLIKIENILDEYGWLGPEQIGSKGNQTLFLVIQHSDLKVQEKYLPMMREAVNNQKANPADLALLEDRVLIRKGKKQLYGSQLEMDSNTKKYKVSPIEDEPNVNKRRAEVGLEPLEEYLKYWDIVYVVPKK